MFFRHKIYFSQCSVLLVLFLVLTFACTSPAGAQMLNRPSNAKAWSDFVYARYQKIQTMRAHFEQTISHKESGIEEQRSGELYFKKPFLVRWVSNPPFAETIVVDKNFLWQYFPEEELALKFPAASVDEQSEFLAVLAGRAPLSDKFRIQPKEEVEGVQSLKLFPFEPSMSLVEATIWVDMESGLILRLVYSDFYGNINDIAFINQELDIKIAADTFNMSLPPDTTIEDHSK